MIDWLINLAKKTPYTHLDDYMERYWLIPYGKLPVAARIHHILKSDDDRAFHDHPWPYMTIILKGGYWEVTPSYDMSGLYTGEKRTWHGAGSVLFRKAKTWHRLEIPEGEQTWTLFVTGKWQQKWGFMPNPKTKVPYKEYLG